MLLVAAVDKVKGWNSGPEAARLREALAEVSVEPYAASRAYESFAEGFVTTYVGADDVTREQIDAELARRGANAGLDPRVGAAIATFGLATAAESKEAEAADLEPFSYHFGTVVAKSGDDYVTLENYARRDARVQGSTGSGGDPLFFFSMYSVGGATSWHRRQVGTGNFLGATLSFAYA
jgi:hypothetical protein